MYIYICPTIRQHNAGFVQYAGAHPRWYKQYKSLVGAWGIEQLKSGDKQ